MALQSLCGAREGAKQKNETMLGSVLSCCKHMCYMLCCCAYLTKSDPATYIGDRWSWKVQGCAGLCSTAWYRLYRLMQGNVGG